MVNITTGKEAWIENLLFGICSIHYLARLATTRME
ncbi:hypothetical protein AB3S75_011375 [Citrus x aurantiifolia]